MERRAIADTGLSIAPICFGTSGLGNMPDTYGYEVGESRARETLEAIFEGPANFLDTSNNYGAGRSEARIGDAIRARGGLPDGFVLSTKLDRDMETGHFDAALAPVREVERLCAKHGVAPGALALQFSMRDPRVTSTIAGVTKPERVTETLGWATAEIPDALWSAIERFDASVEDPEADRDYRPG